MPSGVVIRLRLRERCFAYNLAILGFHIVIRSQLRRSIAGFFHRIRRARSGRSSGRCACAGVRSNRWGACAGRSGEGCA